MVRLQGERLVELATMLAPNATFDTALRLTGEIGHQHITGAVGVEHCCCLPPFWYPQMADL